MSVPTHQDFHISYVNLRVYQKSWLCNATRLLSLPLSSKSRGKVLKADHPACATEPNEEENMSFKKCYRPEGPSTHHFRFLILNTGKGMVAEPETLEFLGYSTGHQLLPSKSLRTQVQGLSNTIELRFLI